MTSETLAELEATIITCRRCPRLVEWRERVGEIKRRAFREVTYWAKPVPGFGDAHARVLVVGLAPGAHGSNRTGRMFTGDDSGKFLYPALHRAGFANQPTGTHRGDGLVIRDLWITALCRCVPPDNKPTPQEIAKCREYLQKEMRLIPTIEGIVAFGQIAYSEIVSGFKKSSPGESFAVFSHGGFVPSNGNRPWVAASYHPSRQNTQTGRLTAGMFDQIWIMVNQLLENQLFVGNKPNPV
jgi:uracil-DNA glycosylase